MCIKVSVSFSVFDCKGQAAWELTVDDNVKISKQIQKWISESQNRCPETPDDYWTNSPNLGGIGSGITLSVVTMLKAFEAGKIYRPSNPWLWSYKNASSCTGGIDAIDCFNIPLSTCLLDRDVIYQNTSSEIMNSASNFQFPADICTMGKAAKKTILWVFGQFLHYHIRLGTVGKKFIRDRMEQIFPKIAPKVDPKTGYTCVSASIHVRAGAPDFHRKHFNGTEHKEVLVTKSKELQKLYNQTICTVYVSSDHLEELIFFPPNTFPSTNITAANNNNNHQYSVEFIPSQTMQDEYFTYKTLPHLLMEPGEIEYQVNHWKNDPTMASQGVTMEYIYLEYLCDLILFAQTDIFIGSHSNAFAIVAPLRVAYNPGRQNDDTCFLDSRSSYLDLKCLGTYDAALFFRDAYGGFNGGSVFF
jgi:hypothetical protein